VAVCCQNLPLGALSSRSASCMLVGELLKKLGLFLNTGVFNPCKTHWGRRRPSLLKSHCALVLDYATHFADFRNFKVYWDAVEINLAVSFL
jgi:hypothetical protein